MKVALFLALVATGLTWFEFVAPLFEGESAITDPYSLPYYVPALLVTTLGAGAALRPALRSHAAVTLGIVGIWTFVAKIDNIGSWWWLDTMHLVLATTLTASALLLTRFAGVRLGTGPVVWPALAGTAAVAWVVGEWLPWLNFTTSDGGKTSVIGQCCFAFGGRPVDSIYTATSMALIVLAAVMFALISSADAT